MTNLTKDNFWDTDLEDIEATFLKKGTKITDLPVYQKQFVSTPPLKDSLKIKLKVFLHKLIK